jgi:alkanesulfonate monooxygenase SsuD/methylene tetrahydromethanopterin reductase-like flavin-dependent oxidoreductase (luciferase family)
VGLEPAAGPIRGHDTIWRPGQGGNRLSRDPRECEKAAQKIKCSYFIHVGEGAQERQRAQERMVDYITMAGLRKTMNQGGQGLPPSMEYFKRIGERVNDAKASDFDDNSLLYGSPQQIIDTLKRAEAIGIDEVILYFNFGNRPDAFVREQMHRFMEEIAPAFLGATGQAAAE